MPRWSMRHDGPAGTSLGRVDWVVFDRLPHGPPVPEGLIALTELQGLDRADARRCVDRSIWMSHEARSDLADAGWAVAEGVDGEVR